jgi:hypothetical protein
VNCEPLSGIILNPFPKENCIFDLNLPGMVTTIKKGSSRTKIARLLKQHTLKKNYVDIKKYCGILKLNEDPMKLQKHWRDEWE